MPCFYSSWMVSEIINYYNTCYYDLISIYLHTLNKQGVYYENKPINET